ncbi:MAG: hypothetical protein ACHRHE_03790 [Tepidisphaerales bacterium]
MASVSNGSPPYPHSRFGFPELCSLFRADPPAAVCRRLILLVVILGAVYTLSQYLPNRSYWRDEAYMLLNIMDKPAGGLLGKLDNAQAAPPVFLWSERGMYLAFGSLEWVMRLLPLVCGIGALAMFAALAWRTLSPGAAVWAVVGFAFCDELVWHAVSLKQYSGDALMSAILLTVALWPRVPVVSGSRCKGSVGGDGSPSRPCPPHGGGSGETAPPLAITAGMSLWPAGRRLLWVAIVAAVGAWLSFTALIVFGGISLALLPGVWREGRRARVAWMSGNVLVAVSGLVLYLLCIRHQHDPMLFRFWAEDMADYSRPWTIPWFIIRESYRLCEVPYRAIGPITMLLVLAGGWFLWKSGRRQTLGILVGPVVMTIVAACLRQYPYHGGRVTVFLLPGVLLMAGFGLEAIRQHAPMPWRQGWWLPGLLMLLLGAGEASYRVFVPMGRSQIRPVVQYVREHRRAGEAIYLVGEGSSPGRPLTDGESVEFFCYWRHPEPPVHVTMHAPGKIPERRFWVAFCFLPKHKGTRFLDPLLERIRQTADEKDRIVVKEGGAAFLFEKRDVELRK